MRSHLRFRPQLLPAQGFGTELPQFEGNVYTNNSIAHPNLEFSIKDFSQLYKEETGKTLTASSVIYIGAFGGLGPGHGQSLRRSSLSSR